MLQPWMTVRVAAKRQETEEICALELVDPAGDSLPPFSAGAHVDVRLRDGLVRPYSLCNSPAEQHRYEIAVLREPASRGGSRAVHEEIAEGDLISIGAPRNHFALAAEAARSLLLAGGIGVTPILCMAERLAMTGSPFEMHYCARSASRAAFLQRIAAAPFAASVHLHFDDGPQEQRLDLPSLLRTHRADAHLYVCGPGGFMEWVLGTAKAEGWPEERLHREYFSAAPVQAGGDAAFEVVLASSGAAYHVPADRSVAAVLADQGIEIPLSCEQGICGTCITRILEGEPDHRDAYLTDDERSAGDQFTPCCSRAKGPRLVLDL